jgi:hypothetical protein
LVLSLASSRTECSRSTPTAFDDSRYSVPIHDDQSSYSDVSCVAGKDEIVESIIKLVTYWERQTGHVVLTVRSDHGTEFQGALSAWCNRLAVRYKYRAVYAPEQNGRSKRMNRTYIVGSGDIRFSVTASASIGLVQ